MMKTFLAHKSDFNAGQRSKTEMEAEKSDLHRTNTN
jgi:hypothetical protein